MDWKLHILFSFILYFLISLFFHFSIAYGISAFLVLIFSSLLPDIDHPKSLIRAVVFSLMFYVLAIFVVLEVSSGILVKIVLLAIILVLTYAGYKKLPLRHRGRKSLHQWRFFVVFSGVCIILFSLGNIDLTLDFFFSLGYGSHLILDKIRKF
jgi:inner membrane protein